MTDGSAPRDETLAEFKDSFYYGKRSNLNVKFLADLTADEAGTFVAEMLGEISELLDHGRPETLIETFIAWQRHAYGAHLDAKARFVYADGPYEPVMKPLPECRVVLVSSSGHFVDGDDPQPLGVTDMTQAEAEARITEFLRADPSLSMIPIDTPPERLRVRHGGYPVGAVREDHQVALPIDHLRSLAAEGRIGALSPNAYSFVGATAQLRLRDQVALDWAEMLRAEEADLALFVPV